MTTDGEPRARRRFNRPGSPPPRDLAEPLASLHAEVLLLREENARLKSAQHQAADVGRLLDRARQLRGTDHAARDDDTAQLLVDGLVIRESLLEICREIERSMVAFEAKLDALAAAPVQLARERSPEHANGNGSRGD
jgi:hypothetical protein